jgi:hypothetical protein
VQLKRRGGFRAFVLPHLLLEPGPDLLPRQHQAGYPNRMGEDRLPLEVAATAVVSPVLRSATLVPSWCTLFPRGVLHCVVCGEKGALDLHIFLATQT